MTHAFDPELAAVLPVLPADDLEDLTASRARFAAVIAELPPPDTTGLRITRRELAEEHAVLRALALPGGGSAA